MYGLRIVRSSALRTVRLQAGVRPFSTTFVVRADGTGKSHATDPDNASYGSSYLPITCLLYLTLY